MTPRRSPAPELSASQRSEELVLTALNIIEQEIRRRRSRAPAGALAMIREPTFKSRVATAVEETQRWKATTKPEEWGYSMRYGVLTAQQRDAAAKIAAALNRLRVAFKPFESNTLERGLVLDMKLERVTETYHRIEFPLTGAELTKWQQHFQEIADAKVRPGSSFDGRKSVAVHYAADLLRAVGLPLAQTHNGTFEQLSAILWGGEPDTHFERYLKAFIKSERARARTE